MVLLDQFPREVVFVAKILGADSCYCHSQITTTSPTRNSSPGPEKMSSFLGTKFKIASFLLMFIDLFGRESGGWALIKAKM